MQLELFEILAGVCLLYVLHAIYKYYLRGGINLKQYGDYAVVTGATDGIGKELCFELARKGLNIVLISRTESKLKEVEKALTDKYKVQTMTLAIDYSRFDAGAEAKVKAALNSLDVAVLVNNVGVSYEYPKYLKDLSATEVQGLADLNITSTVAMTRIVLPRMEQRGKGIIVNMSSGSSAMGGCPLLTLYASAKAYVNQFSSSLHYEYAGSSKDIRVQSQTPLYVASKLSKMKASFTVPTPKAFARASVKQMGRETLISPYPVHALMLWAFSFVPESILLKQVMGIHLSIKKRALDKLAKAKGM